MVLRMKITHWLTGNGTIGRCFLLGVGVELLNEVCQWGEI